MGQGVGARMDPRELNKADAVGQVKKDKFGLS